MGVSGLQQNGKVNYLDHLCTVGMVASEVLGAWYHPDILLIFHFLEHADVHDLPIPNRRHDHNSVGITKNGDEAQEFGRQSLLHDLHGELCTNSVPFLMVDR